MAPWACSWEWLQCVEECEIPSEPIVAEVHNSIEIELEVFDDCIDICEKGYLTCHTYLARN